MPKRTQIQLTRFLVVMIDGDGSETRKAVDASSPLAATMHCAKGTRVAMVSDGGRRWRFTPNVDTGVMEAADASGF